MLSDNARVYPTNSWKKSGGKQGHGMTQRGKIDIFPHWVIRDRDSESRSLPCFPPDFFQEFVGYTLALSDSMYIRMRLPDCPSTTLDSSRQKCGFPGGEIRREQWITLGCKWDIGRGNKNGRPVVNMLEATYKSSGNKLRY